MRQIITGSILYNKNKKLYEDKYGNLVSEPKDAYIYKSHKEAEKELETFESSEYKVLDIQIVIKIYDKDN